MKSIYWLRKPILGSRWSWKMTCARSVAWFLNFLSNRVSLDCFLQPNILPKHSKIIVTCPKQEKQTSRVNFDFPKISKMSINFDLFKVSKMTSWKIYISSVTEKLETPNFLFQILCDHKIQQILQERKMLLW